MDDRYLKCLVRAFLAGVMIAIGGCVFIGCSNKGYAWVGAVLFSIGLITIFTFGLDLYTGKVGYAVNNKPGYLLDLLVIIAGNFLGCLVAGFMVSPELGNTAVQFVAARMDNPDYLKVLFKGVFCGMLMFIAADIYKKRNSYIGAIVAVPVFILAGFEHSIADMFYFCAAGFNGSEIAFSLDAVLFIVIVIIGNGIGGILIPGCAKYMYEKREEEKKE